MKKMIVLAIFTLFSSVIASADSENDKIKSYISSNKRTGESSAPPPSIHDGQKPRTDSYIGNSQSTERSGCPQGYWENLNGTCKKL